MRAACFNLDSHFRGNDGCRGNDNEWRGRHCGGQVTDALAARRVRRHRRRLRWRHQMSETRSGLSMISSAMVSRCISLVPS